MQGKLLYIFTEKDFQNESFLADIQDPQYAVIFLTEDGEGSIVQQKENIILKKNSIVFFEPNEFLAIETTTIDLTVKVLIYKKDFLTDLNIKLNKLKIFKYFSQYFKEFADFPQKEMDLILEQIKTIKLFLDYEKRIGFDDKILESLFSAFIYTITGIYLQKDFFESHQMSHADEIAFQFTKHVFSHCTTEKSPAFYADLQSITSRHLTSMVKLVTGKTATQIIAEFVINEARILLISTDRTVTEIADDLNFADSYTFSHYFKRYDGKSPAHFRKTEV